MNKPTISLIAAMAKNRVIGKDNQMPWHLPIDLKHFKQVTMGKPVIMGRKTFESIGRPLPGRVNLVITRNQHYQPPNCQVAFNFVQAIEMAMPCEEVMVIGGGHIYKQALTMANKLYLTLIELTVDGDTQFPEYQHLNLKLLSEQRVIADDKNPYDLSFIEYQVNR